jgi:HK97 gp10 family phage protein
MARFEDEVNNWVRGTRQEMKKGVRQATFGLFEGLSDNTPVRTGFLRGSWQVNLNSSAAEEGEYDKSGTIGKSAALDVLGDYRVGDTIYILNSAYYARFVEFGTQHIQPRLFATSVLQNARSIGEAAIRGF